MKAPKPDPRPFPWRALPVLVARFAAAAESHADPDPDRPGWLDVDTGEYRAALMRHFTAWAAGDTSEDHEAAIACNALVLLARR